MFGNKWVGFLPAAQLMQRYLLTEINLSFIVL
jgi:hypothetical protein